jgi:transcriptional regulator with XRE-family HTH domain
MYSHPQKLTVDDAALLRREAGHWLKERREAQALSQRQLAAKVGVEYYSFISQLETGHGRIPPDRYLIWAEALGVAPRAFVAKLMQFYDPVTYGILFEDSMGRPIAAVSLSPAENPIIQAACTSAHKSSQ